MARPSRTLCASCTNFGHLSSMNFHCHEYARCQTIPSMLLFWECQVIRFAWINVPYILHRHGMNEKCLNTLCGTIDLPWTLYLDSPHFKHWSTLSWGSWKSMQPFVHECMTLYAKPNLFKVVVVSCLMVGNVFDCGSTLHFSKPNNSFTNAFVVPSVLQQFIINNVATKFDRVKPS